MKKLVPAFIVVFLVIVILWLTVFRKNKVHFVATSNLVNFASAHKGDLLVFEVPRIEEAGLGDKGKKNTTYYVHFAKGASPCAKELIPSNDDKQPQCEVIVKPSAAARFYFYIDAIHDRVGKCPPGVCSGLVVVGPKPDPGPVPLVPLPKKSVPYPATEVLVYNVEDADPMADPASVSAYQGRQVTWVTNGIDKYGYIVKFTDSICEEGDTITAKPEQKEYCTLNGDPRIIGPHSYTYTVGNDPKGTKKITGLQLTVKEPAISDPK